MVPGIAALRRPYGLGLLGKAAVDGGLLTFAARNRWVLVPPLAAAAAGADRRFARILRMEDALIAGALLITAGLTTVWGIEAS